jgi:hypothetical protein
VAAIPEFILSGFREAPVVRDEGSRAGGRPGQHRFPRR